MKKKRGYWSLVANDWQSKKSDWLWRVHNDTVNSSLFDEWAPESNSGTLLKTDMFDESFGIGIRLPSSLDRWNTIGIDIAPEVLKTARFQTDRFQLLASDVRSLPFSSGSFDLIFSNSTLLNSNP